MSSFWNLVGFEYKKILSKKSVIILLLLAVGVTAFSVWGTLLGNSYVDGRVLESHYDGMLKDRAYARSLAGREIDTSLIMEAVHAYSKLPESDRYIDTPEYETYARRYSGIYAITRAVYNSALHSFITSDNFRGLTQAQAEQFYVTRRSRQVKTVEETRMSNKVKQKVLTLDSQIKTPFTFSYIDGYTRSFTLMYTVGLLAAFVMAICISPLFAGEYSSGADQLILASRHGKHRLIQAKLFTGFSLAAAICIILILITFVLSLLTFGFDGSDSPLQLYYPMSPYPLTMAQTALLFSVCTLFACLMTAAITMLLSAKFRSSFGVIILVSLLLVVPMFIHITYSNIVLYNLFHLLPSNMMDFGVVTSPIQYELCGLVLNPYVFLPVFAAVVSVLLTPFVYRSFKKHQK